MQFPKHPLEVDSKSQVNASEHIENVLNPPYHSCGTCIGTFIPLLISVRSKYWPGNVAHVLYLSGSGVESVCFTSQV